MNRQLFTSTWICAASDRTARTLILLGCLALLLGVPTRVPGQVVRVGVLLPMSGRLAPIGSMEKSAFSMAAAAANDKGGIHGSRLKFVFADTAGDPDAARAAAERLISQGVMALTGAVSGAVAWEVANLAQEHKTPFLVATASADRITEKGLSYVFRISAPASEQFLPLRSFLQRATDVSTAAILWDQDMGEFLYRRFLRMFQRIDVRVVMRESYRSRGTDPMELFLPAMIKDPHLVCVIARGEIGGMLIRSAREMGLHPRALLGGTTDFATEDFAVSAGEFSEHVYALTPWVPSAPYPSARPFYESFSRVFGAPPDYHAAQAFAAAEVITDGLRRASEKAPEAMKEALAATDRMTVFGPVRFVAYGQKTQQNRAPIFLVQWQGGEPEIVWPRSSATAPYIYPLPLWLDDDLAGGPFRNKADRLHVDR